MSREEVDPVRDETNDLELGDKLSGPFERSTGIGRMVGDGDDPYVLEETALEVGLGRLG